MIFEQNTNELLRFFWRNTHSRAIKKRKKICRDIQENPVNESRFRVLASGPLLYENRFLLHPKNKQHTHRGRQKRHRREERRGRLGPRTPGVEGVAARLVCGLKCFVRFPSSTEAGLLWATSRWALLLWHLCFSYFSLMVERQLWLQPHPHHRLLRA